MLELNRIFILLYSLIITVVLLSACISVFLYFYEGHRTGWTFNERFKVMRSVLEEKYREEYTNIFQQIFFFVQFKVGWIRFIAIVGFLFLILVGLSYLTNS